ncbi:MAG: terpene cyclase/mutase family protein [Actinomycetota bacterium]|nr:terpene cyclase/mutase family protein [Actinomycetota bacterium]
MKKKRVFFLFIAAGLLFGLAQGQMALATDGGGSSSNVKNAIDYLRKRQTQTGGFSEPGKDASDALTCWAVSALSSAGERPSEWKKSGKSPLDFLANRSSGWKTLTDIERACLAISSAGGNPKSFRGRNLVQEINKRISADGHIGEQINEHIWGMIALAASGETVPEKCRAWLRSNQRPDGGFGFSQDSESDPDDTGAAIEALVSCGENPLSNTVKRALEYLKFCQAADGGFCWRSTNSNTASTAWAAQGIVAAGQDPDSSEWEKNGKTPIDFLESMQQSDGHVKYMESDDSQPAWMTTEAIPALGKRPYPLNFTPPGSTSSTGKTSYESTETSEDDSNAESVSSSLESNQSTDDEKNTSGTKTDSKRKEGGAEIASRSDGSGMVSEKASASGSIRVGLYPFLLICLAYLALVIVICLGQTLLSGD